MHLRIAPRARRTSARSFCLCLRNVVNRTIRRSSAKQNVTRRATRPRSTRSSKEPAAPRPQRREPQTAAILGKSLDRRRHRRELSHGEQLDPLLNFRLDLHQPHDISNDIKRLARSRCPETRDDTKTTGTPNRATPLPHPNAVGAGMVHKQLNSWLRTHGHVRSFVPPLPETLGQYLQ